MARKTIPLKAEPQTYDLTNSQVYVLSKAQQEAAAIQSNAIGMVCAELGIPLPANGTNVVLTEDKKLVIG